MVQSQTQTKRKSKILVVEDAEPLRNDILDMLTFEGFEVRGEENGALGIDAAYEYLPDLIVCDIMMPVKDGYHVLKELQHDPRTRAIPFIFLTAKTDRQDRIQGMGMGADDYLPKPFMATELLETINARLKRRNDYKQMAEDKVKELSESIITALPHELRTPLNTIMGFSDMLSSEAYSLKPPQIIDWSEHIHSASQRLYRLVENYVTYARVETIARDGARVSSLRDKVTEPSPIIEIQADQKAQSLNRLNDVNKEIFGDAKIRISEEDLSKIVEELVDNAIKFSEADTPIHVKGEVRNGMYAIAVTDKGRGMTDEQIEDIGAHRQFDRWLNEQQGNGLGLAITRRLVELYEGKLHMESKVNEGTTVTIMLPLASDS